MPEIIDSDNVTNECDDVFEDFLGNLTCQVLIRQMMFFIIRITDSSSEKEAGKELFLTLKWMRKSRKESVLNENTLMVEELDCLAKRLFLECKVFKVPFYWENHDAYQKEAEGKQGFINPKNVRWKGILL